MMRVTCDARAKKIFRGQNFSRCFNVLQFFLIIFLISILIQLFLILAERGMSVLKCILCFDLFASSFILLQKHFDIRLIGKVKYSFKMERNSEKQLIVL